MDGTCSDFTEAPDTNPLTLSGVTAGGSAEYYLQIDVVATNDINDVVLYWNATNSNGNVDCDDFAGIRVGTKNKYSCPDFSTGGYFNTTATGIVNCTDFGDYVAIRLPISFKGGQSEQHLINVTFGNVAPAAYQFDHEVRI